MKKTGIFIWLFSLLLGMIPVMAADSVAGQYRSELTMESLKSINPQRKYLGFNGETIYGLSGDDSVGIEVLRLIIGSQAEIEGIKVGDIILKFNGQPAHNIQVMSNLLQRVNENELIEIELLRDNQRQTIRFNYHDYQYTPAITVRISGDTMSFRVDTYITIRCEVINNTDSVLWAGPAGFMAWGFTGGQPIISEYVKIDPHTSITYAATYKPFEFRAHSFGLRIRWQYTVIDTVPENTQSLPGIFSNELMLNIPEASETVVLQTLDYNKANEEIIYNLLFQFPYDTCLHQYAEWVRPLLKVDNINLAAWAARSLALIGDTTITDEVIGLMISHPDEMVLYNALAKLKAKSAVPFIYDQLLMTWNSNPNESNLIRISEALARILELSADYVFQNRDEEKGREVMTLWRDWGRKNLGR